MRWKRSNQVYFGYVKMVFDGVYQDGTINPIRCGDFMVSNEPCWGEILSDHSSGIYSTKSAYLWLLRYSSSNAAMEGILKLITSLQTLPKINVFAWRACQVALPTGNRLLSAGLDDGLCKLCEGEVETGVHAQRDCELTKEILNISGVPVCMRDADHVSIKDWLSAALLSLHMDLFTSLVVLLRNIWNRRIKRWIRLSKEIRQ
ncbi:hypothetical protein GQ457_15G019990 [Hibiscus cannabinus]